MTSIQLKFARGDTVHAVKETNNRKSPYQIYSGLVIQIVIDATGIRYALNDATCSEHFEDSCYATLEEATLEAARLNGLVGKRD